MLFLLREKSYCDLLFLLNNLQQSKSFGTFFRIAHDNLRWKARVFLAIVMQKKTKATLKK